MPFFLFVLALSFLTWSCNQTPPASERSSLPENFFYPVQDFFQAEIKRLSQENRRLERLSRIDADSSLQTFQPSDWAKTLGPFLSLDLNKKAWFDAYERRISQDSIWTYQALRADLPIQRLDLYFDAKGELEQVLAVLRLEQLLYQSDSHLIYRRNWGFQILKKLKLRYGTEREYELRGLFQLS